MSEWKVNTLLGLEGVLAMGERGSMGIHINIKELEIKLNKLREEYKTAKTGDKKLLEIRGKILKRIIEKNNPLMNHGKQESI